MKIRLYCTCGDTAKGTVTPDAKAESFKQTWDKIHSGPDHAPCDAKTAAAARRKLEKAGAPHA